MLLRWILIVFISLFPTISYAEKIENGQRFRALVIGIDGMKGAQFYQRVFQDDEAPNLKAIANLGQFAVCSSVFDPHCARTHLGPRYNVGYKWVTSTGWATVLTGVDTDKHLVKDNEFESQIVFSQTTKNYPTFLGQLKQHGFVTAAGGVGNYMSSMDTNDDGSASVSTGILDFECGFNAEERTSSVDAKANNSCNVDFRQSFDGGDSNRDVNLTHWLVNMINTDGGNSPDVIMGVYDTIDHAGHHFGYSSNPGYMSAISTVDSNIGDVIQAVKTRSVLKHEVWLVMVTSDHGGHVNSDGSGGHDVVFFHDEVIPLVVGVFGEHVKLTHQGPISTLDAKQMDVSPTVLHWFGLSQAVTDGTIRSEYLTN
jgi:hypothetical protein